MALPSMCRLTPAAAAASSSTSLTPLGEPRNAKSSYSQAFNLQLQYQVTPNTVAEVAYVGTGARHVQASIPTNTVSSILPPSTNVKTVQFFPDFANGGTFIARSGQTNYNSLQANLEHRFSSNFSLLANFTLVWKCLGDFTRPLLGQWRRQLSRSLRLRTRYECGLRTLRYRCASHCPRQRQLPTSVWQEPALANAWRTGFGIGRLVHQLDTDRAGWPTAYDWLHDNKRVGPGLQCALKLRRKIPMRAVIMPHSFSTLCVLCESSGCNGDIGRPGEPWR